MRRIWARNCGFVRGRSRSLAITAKLTRLIWKLGTCSGARGDAHLPLMLGVRLLPLMLGVRLLLLLPQRHLLICDIALEDLVRPKPVLVVHRGTVANVIAHVEP